jgi:pSer/pThr/pTyr-binding forkhead associated (FHA) protein
LKGRRASRKHAVIRYQQGSYFIYSLNPQNPVAVNDQPIDQGYMLQPGDVIYAGETILRFEPQG